MGKWVKCEERMPEPWRQVWTNCPGERVRMWVDDQQLWWTPAGADVLLRQPKPPSRCPTVWYDDDDAPPDPPEKEREGWHCPVCGNGSWAETGWLPVGRRVVFCTQCKALYVQSNA